MDLEEERKIKRDQIEKFSKDNGLFYFEVSAKENKANCVNEAFDHFLKSIYDSKKIKHFKDNQEKINRMGEKLQLSAPTRKRKCCILK